MEKALKPALPVAVVAIMLKSVHPDLRNQLAILAVKQVILSKNVLIDQDLGQLHIKFVLMIGTLTKALDNNLLVQVKLFKILMLITTVLIPPLLVMMPLVVMMFSPVFHLLTFSWKIQI